MVCAHLHRIDHTANMARFYAIALQPTLFGEVSVMRFWGRIGTSGRMRIETFPTRLDAERQATQVEGRKRRRGYV